MDAQDFIRKMSIAGIENPNQIWESLEKFYGIGFFYEIIEKEFGVSPDTNDVINNEIMRQMNACGI